MRLIHGVHVYFTVTCIFLFCKRLTSSRIQIIIIYMYITSPYQYGWFRYIFLRLPLNYNLSKFWFSEQHLQEIGNLQFYTVYERVEKK